MKKQLEWIMKHLAFNMHQSLKLSKSPRSEMQGEQCGIGRSCTGQGDLAPQVKQDQQVQQVPHLFLCAVPLTEGFFP